MNSRLADTSRVVFRVRTTERYRSSQEKEFLNKIYVNLYCPWTRQKRYSLFKDCQVARIVDLVNHGTRPAPTSKKVRSGPRWRR